MENHDHVFAHTVVSPTCQESGYTLHRCACGYEYKDKFTPPGDHSFAAVQQRAPTCTEAGNRWLRCSVCGLE